MASLVRYFHWGCWFNHLGSNYLDIVGFLHGLSVTMRNKHDKLQPRCRCNINNTVKENQSNRIYASFTRCKLFSFSLLHFSGVLFINNFTIFKFERDFRVWMDDKDGLNSSFVGGCFLVCCGENATLYERVCRH